MENRTSEENINYFCTLLQKCPVEKLETIIHHLIDFLCGQKQVVYKDYSDIWSLTEWWDLEYESQNFFQSFFNKSNKVKNNLLLPEDFIKIIHQCFEIRKVDIKNSLLTKTHAISPCYLRDFDWKLKLTLASDKMAQINEPRLLLDLDLSGNEEKCLLLDLSKEELKNLIDSMEKTRTALGEVTIPN